jgi:nitrous oxidase accessory protein
MGQVCRVAILLLLVFIPLPSMVAGKAGDSSFSGTIAYQLPELNWSEPIDINGDHDFEFQFGHTGNGTLDSPYIIENYSTDINRTDTDPINPDIPPVAIKIWNTRCHFIIRNCTIRGWARWDYDPYYETPAFDIDSGGIGLHNVSNGVVFNNTFILTGVAFGGWDIYNNTFINNTVYGNVITGKMGYYGCQGIDLNWDSIDNIVANNSVQNVAYALVLADAHRNLVENNTFISSDAGILLSVNSSFNSVSFNDCSSNRVGIALDSCHYNSINNNTCMYNNMTGIVLNWDCTNNTVSGNLVAFNGLDYAPVQTTSSDDMILAQSARGYGIWIDSDPSKGPNRLNKIAWNDIIRNGMNGRNDEAENSYDYNFWSDYDGTDYDGDMIGDTEYFVSGDSPTSDPHPRISTRYLDLLQTKSSDSGGLPTEILLTLTILVSCVCLVIFFFRRRT